MVIGAAGLISTLAVLPFMQEEAANKLEQHNVSLVNLPDSEKGNAGDNAGTDVGVSGWYVDRAGGFSPQL